jgi:hypothetical protein
VDWDHKKITKKRSKLVVTSLGQNTIKHVLDGQRSDINCKNRL